MTSLEQIGFDLILIGGLIVLIVNFGLFGLLLINLMKDGEP